MGKKADVQYVVHELIAARWSPRSFADRPVEDENLSSLFEAARWAASAFNEQPWSFVFAHRTDKEAFDRIHSCLSERNRLWAGRAAVLCVSVAALSFRHNEKPNRHALHDVGQAVGQLVLEATARGLCAHQMAGFDAVRARELLGIPAGHEPVAAIAIGYPGRVEDLPELFQAQEQAARTRKLQSEFVFRGRWGK